jgi:hypothetical protein
LPRKDAEGKKKEKRKKKKGKREKGKGKRENIAADGADLHGLARTKRF